MYARFKFVSGLFWVSKNQVRYACPMVAKALCFSSSHFSLEAISVISHDHVKNNNPQAVRKIGMV